MKTRFVTDNERGDFVRDAKQDPQLPDAQSWHDLQAYLKRKGAGPDVLRPAKELWNLYCKTRRPDLQLCG